MGLPQLLVVPASLLNSSNVSSVSVNVYIRGVSIYMCLYGLVLAKVKHLSHSLCIWWLGEKLLILCLRLIA